MKYIVGYQGDIGSNSETAAEKFVAKIASSEDAFELKPLTTSSTTIGQLMEKKIDFAVVATRNSIAKVVEETYQCVKSNYSLELCDTEILKITHCLFKRPDAQLEEITKVASHIQALKQTKEIRKTLGYKWIEEVEEDTALAAKKLGCGQLGKEYAVICTEKAGALYGLERIGAPLILPENKTEFRIFKRKKPENNKPSFLEWLKYRLAVQSKFEFISTVVLTVAAVIALIVTKTFGFNSLDDAITIAGFVSALLWIFSSEKFKDKVANDTVVGYWKYMPMSEDNKQDDSIQKFFTPRIVEIAKSGEGLKLTGWKCDGDNTKENFTSKTGGVILTPIGPTERKLVYEYTGLFDNEHLDGIVYMDLDIKNPASKVNMMSGHYYGYATNDKGTITYCRISKEEFEKHKECSFL